MRVTSSSLARGYNSRLNRVLSNLNMANEKVTTKRKYLKASENPALSVRAKRLEREMANTEDYLNNVNATLDTYECVESAMMEISNYTDSVYAESLRAINGTISPEQRGIIATEIRQIQESAIKSLNSRFEDKFLFGGSSTKELPFTLGDDGKLNFRGIPVDSAPGTPEYEQLQKMAQETIYVDLGFGLKVDNNNPADPNKVQETSAFNTCIPGISFIGYGTDANGNTNNLINTLGQIADIMEKDPLDQENLKLYADKLNDQRTTLLVNVTKIGSSTIFLENTKTRLENNEYVLNNKIEKTEYGDMPELIMDFTEQQYVYQAALKMGTKVLSNSFIDYMS